jgi:hypothetical protein
MPLLTCSFAVAQLFTLKNSHFSEDYPVDERLRYVAIGANIFVRSHKHGIAFTVALAQTGEYFLFYTAIVV